MKIEQLNESISDVVYHATTYRNAFMIMKSDEFHMRTSFGNRAESKFAEKKDRHFFMSTMRSLTSAIAAHEYDVLEVVFVLDGRKLSQRYKGIPVSYFSTRNRRSQPHEDEMEDRLLSKNRVIKNFSRYIKEIYIIFEEYESKNKYTPESKRYYIRKVITEAKLKKIPVEVFPSARNMILGNNKYALSDIVELLKQTPRTKSKTIDDELDIDWFPNYLKTLRELADKDRFHELSDDAKDSVRNMGYIRASSIDARMSQSSLSTKNETFLRAMRRHKWFNSRDIEIGLKEKWGRIIAVLDSYNAARGIMPTKKKDQLDYVAYNPEGALEAMVYNDVKIFRDVVNLAIELDPDNKSVAEEAKKKGLIKR